MDTSLSSLLKITDYWRRVQVSSSFESLKDIRSGPGDALVIRSNFTLSDFELGRCPQDVVKRGFAAADRKQEDEFQRLFKRNSRAVRPDPISHVDVVFSPFSVTFPGETHGKDVVFGQALVDRLGIMTTPDVSADLPPVWISREFLSPGDGIDDDLFPLADADNYYLATREVLRSIKLWPVEWPDLLATFDMIWSKACGFDSSLFHLIQSRRVVKAGWIRVELRDTKKLTIIKIYEKIKQRIANGNAPFLYRECAIGRRRQIFTSSNESIHRGQMGGTNALAPSQRESLLSYLSAPTGSVSAINGPPGTGKTTLLQSVVASEFVNRALGESDAPLFIACAATNQAVSNIIGAFRGATESLTDPLADRWISGLGRRFGVFFRSGQGEGASRAKGSLICVPYNFSTYKDVTEQQIRDKVNDLKERNAVGDEVPIDYFLLLGEHQATRDYYVRQASSFFKKSLTLDGSVQALHKELIRLDSLATDYTSAVTDYGTFLKSAYLDRCGSYASAIRVLESSIRDLRKNVEHVVAENLRCESEEAKVEADVFEEERQRGIVAGRNYATNVAKKGERLQELLVPLMTQEQALDVAKTEFRQLSEPASFTDWLAENFFPWVRSAKRGSLMRLVDSLESAGFESCASRTLAGMRCYVTEVFGLSAKIRSAKTILASDHQKCCQGLLEVRDKLWRDIVVAREDRSSAYALTMSERNVAADAAKNKLIAFESRLCKLAEAHVGFTKACGRIGLKQVPEWSDMSGAIDTSLRLRMFLIATHYWEGRFLRNLSRDTSWRLPNQREGAYRLISMIAPCFVSTFDMVGSSFSVMKQDGLNPMWELADTLIIDEAGQASPDKGAFAFAFAKKALVVGDTLQLPPVTGQDSNVFLESIAISAGVITSFAERGCLSGELRASSLPGSVMRMASTSAFFDKSTSNHGMWLLDHFRCDDRIIAYCNEIWYTGETSLVPRIGEKRGAFPPFGHVHVAGRTNNKSNEREALAIMEWLDRNGRLLEKHYNKPLFEIVAVVTPFKNQSEKLRAIRDGKLKRLFCWQNEYVSLDKLIVGTVHSLQGAEKDVVIFSTMYDERKPGYFFDRQHTLLNVAVSRAKQSFIVFGHRDIFTGRSKDANDPSSVLAGYLFGYTMPQFATLPLAG